MFVVHKNPTQNKTVRRTQNSNGANGNYSLSQSLSLQSVNCDNHIKCNIKMLNASGYANLAFDAPKIMGWGWARHFSGNGGKRRRTKWEIYMSIDHRASNIYCIRNERTTFISFVCVQRWWNLISKHEHWTMNPKHWIWQQRQHCIDLQVKSFHWMNSPFINHRKLAISFRPTLATFSVRFQPK